MEALLRTGMHLPYLYFPESTLLFGYRESELLESIHAKLTCAGLMLFSFLFIIINGSRSKQKFLFVME